jgi:hypothetical protein
MTILEAAGVVVLVAVMIFGIYYKLSAALQAIRHELGRRVDNVVTQVEGLLAVHAELQPRHALPRSRGWAASPDLLQLLIGFARQSRSCTVLECSSGLSTVVLAGCARNTKRGHVYSLEHDPHYARQTRDLLALHGLQAWATVLDAPLRRLELPGWQGQWYDVTGLPPELEVDLLVIDGPPATLGRLARYPALPVLAPWLAPSVRVVLDDADRDDERAAVARWLGEHPEFSEEPVPHCEKGCAVLARGA